jgi:hypothetical protein
MTSSNPATRPAKQRKAHVHTFRLQAGLRAAIPLRDKIYHCTDPDCWFYSKAINLIGKRAVCPLCKTEFIMTAKVLRLRLPHCDMCTEGKKAEEVRAEVKSLEQFLKDEFHLEE